MIHPSASGGVGGWPRNTIGMAESHRSSLTRSSAESIAWVHQPGTSIASEGEPLDHTGPGHLRPERSRRRPCPRLFPLWSVTRDDAHNAVCHGGNRGAFPPPSPTNRTAWASSSLSMSTSPSWRASENLAASRFCSWRPAASRGRPFLHVAPGAHRELATGDLRPVQRGGNLREVEPEHLPEHEHRPLDGRQSLKQQQRGDRDRVGEFRGSLRVLVGSARRGSGNHGPS